MLVIDLHSRSLYALASDNPLYTSKFLMRSEELAPWLRAKEQQMEHQNEIMGSN
jgi:hypothetical protein